ncbi:hypothetical protein OL239_11105 [Arthrobacter sp. ATA002]|nr:hypothetical protein OL239_11105 [Arthrobacter sp. ATA002]
MGHGWSFADGVPAETVFDLAYENNASADYFDIFRAAGWMPVLSLGDAHIFRAAPGTAPVHSGGESRRGELIRNRDRYLRYSAIAVAVFLLVVLGIRLAPWNEWLELVLLVVTVVPVVYTVIPLTGYWRHLSTLPH